MEENKKCLQCDGDVATKRNIFCSHTCAAIYNNRNRIAKNHRVKTFCAHCGKAVFSKCKVIPLHQKCTADYNYNQFLVKWKRGEVTGLRGVRPSQYIRRYIFEKFNSKCTVCGWNKTNPYTGKIPLNVEHKDGNYANNTESNLDLLCPSCHSLTATFGSLNEKGKGRPGKYHRKVG